VKETCTSEKKDARNTYLDDLVPTSRDDDRVGNIGAKADTRNPRKKLLTHQSVAECTLQRVPLRVTIFFDVIFTFTQSVPKFYCPVARARNDLPIISTEADGKNI
jgi:hypothetical protein